MVFPTNESFPRNVLGAPNNFTETPIDYRYIVLEDWPFWTVFLFGTNRPQRCVAGLDGVVLCGKRPVALRNDRLRCCEAVLKPKVMDATRWLKALVSVFVKVNVIFLFVKMVSEDTTTMICSVYLPDLLSKMSMPNYTGNMEQGRRSQRVVWKPRSWYHLVSRHGSQMSYAKNHPVPLLSVGHGCGSSESEGSIP